MTKTPRNRFGRAIFCAASAITMVTYAAPVFAQGEERQQISIEAQSLGDALLEIGERYDVSIIVSDELTSGLSAPAISGSLTVSEAIERLLSGSGLSARRSSNGAFLIARSDRAGLASNDSLIVVTGTKRNLTLQDTDTSVTVFTEEQIEEQVLFNFADAALRAPNASIGLDGGFSIRGIDVDGLAGTGAATANIYVDGAPTGRAGLRGAFNLWDVDQIEILRGPQSTVQGRNALAGAIVIQTADPEYDFGAAARVLIGNNDNRQYSAFVTGPIIGDQVAFRLSADYREVDFGVTNVNTDVPAFFEEATTLRGKLLIEPEVVPGLRIELNGQYIDSDTGFFGLNAPGPFGSPQFAAFDPFGDENFNPIGVIDNITANRAIVDVSYEISPNWTAIVLGSFDSSENDSDRTSGFVLAEDDTYAVDWRMRFDYDRVTGWIGAYYFDERSRVSSENTLVLSDFGLVTDPAGGEVTIISDQVRDTENFAIFGDITFELTDKISLNLGARFDWEDVIDTGRQGTTVANFDPCVVPAFGSVPCTAVSPSTSDPAIEASYNAFLPRGAISYAFDDEKSLTFSVQRGYRAGGAFTQATATGPGVNVEFDPEFITNYELAFRSVWLDGRLAFNANAFYSDWSDQQVSIPNALGLANDTVNVGSSELYGLELSMTFQATESFDIFATLGLLETEFTDFPFAIDANGDPVPGDGTTVPVGETAFANLAGNEFPFAPNATASMGFNYEHDSGIFLSGNGSYRDSQFSDVENLALNETDDGFLVNARIGYRWRNFNLSLFANNIFDERFTTAQLIDDIRVTNVVAQSLNTSPVFEVNTPRLYGVELRARF